MLNQHQSPAQPPKASITFGSTLNGVESRLSGEVSKVMTLRDRLFGTSPRDASSGQAAEPRSYSDTLDRIHVLITTLETELNAIAERL